MNKILLNHTKAVVHLRQQFNRKRLGLVFGAGISRGLDFPTWTELVVNIAKHDKVKGMDLYQNMEKWSGNTAVTQMLFQFYKDKRRNELMRDGGNMAYIEKRVLADWRELVHESLYSEALIDRESKIANHPYLRNFIPIIKSTEFSVNYNFDDTLEHMLSSHSSAQGNARSKPCQAVWNSHMQFRVDTAVIYHPNGYLPGDKNAHQSEELIFSEESFSDQLIQSMNGSLSTLLHLFSKKTCLFTGLSLEDSTLKHLLRQSACINPGNYHYYIRYTNSEELTEEQKKAIFDSNFEVFNLITLFLDNNEISELTTLITMEKNDFSRLAAIAGAQIKYVYYLVGTVGAGKSTLLNHFGCFEVYDEWIDDRPSNLARPFQDLSAEEKIEIDRWLDEQFHKKNNLLLEQSEGIHVVDRTPLDPITFSPTEKQMQSRAEFLLRAIAPGSSGFKIQDGHVLFLQVNPLELTGRMLSKRKLDWNADTFKLLQDIAAAIYDLMPNSKIENINRSIGEVVRSAAKIIHGEKFQSADLHAQLVKIAESAT